MIEFEEVWHRVKKMTELRTMNDLASLLGVSQPNISRQKKDGSFPPGWAYLVGKKYGLLTEWIMTGEGPKRLNEVGSVPDQEAAPKGIIEEWVQYVREKESGDGRIIGEMMLKEEFRQWFQEHKSKSPLEVTHEKKSEAA